MVQTILELSDGNVALGLTSGKIQILDPSNGFSSLHNLTGHSLTVRSLTVRVPCISALLQLSNGDLWSGSYDKTIAIWDTVSYTKISKLTDHTTRIDSIVQMDNGQVASSSANEIIIWDVAVSNPSKLRVIPIYWSLSITAIPGPYLITGNGKDLLTEFNPADGSKLATAQGLGDGLSDSGFSNSVLYCPAVNGIINSEATSTVEVWTDWAISH
jgi:WD40 repeat protein